MCPTWSNGIWWCWVSSAYGTHFTVKKNWWLKACKNFSCCNFECDDPNRSQVCTCYDSSALVTCATLWNTSSLLLPNSCTHFHKILIMSSWTLCQMNPGRVYTQQNIADEHWADNECALPYTGSWRSHMCKWIDRMVPSSSTNIDSIALHSHDLTHCGPMTHICVGNLTIIGSNNDLSPDRRLAIIGTSAGKV